MGSSYLLIILYPDLNISTLDGQVSIYSGSVSMTYDTVDTVVLTG